MTDLAGDDTSASGNLSGVELRDATAHDIGRIVELLQHGSLVAGKEDPSDLTPYLTALGEIEAGPGGVVVAECEGAVVGVCQLIVFRHLQSRGGLCAEIESVHVHPDHRSGGIGTLLIGEAIRRAREAGCYRVQLTSNQARPDAHRFYRRLGFEASHSGFKMLLR
jgi:GNAT superfamily N-acetyltransferase